MSEHIVVTDLEGVKHIELRRPDKKNALNRAMYDGISDAIELADHDDAIRVILISGTESCFTAGNDLSEFVEAPPGREESPAGRFLRILMCARKPVIAAVGGVAIGVGTTMLMHCDLTYAADNAIFQLPFVNIGLVPEAGSTLLLPQLCGMPRATELLYFGTRFDAQQALELRLVNEVVPVSDLMLRARQRAADLARQPTGALMATKALLRHSATNTVALRMKEEGDVFTDRLRSSEAKEAMNAFLEKRR